MNRRAFLSLLGAAAVATLVPRKIYCFAPPNGWALSDSGVWSYRFFYRNSLTGCTTEIEKYRGLFTIPEGATIQGFSVGFDTADLIDFYRRAPGALEYEYMETFPTGLKYDHQTD
jgi:hypothetical protein